MAPRYSISLGFHSELKRYNPFDLLATDSIGTRSRVRVEVFRVATAEDTPSGFGFIEKAKGGIVFALDVDGASFGASLEVPPNSLDNDAVVTIKERTSDPLHNPGYLPVGPQIEVDIIGAAISGAPGTRPIITVPYRADLVDVAGEFHHTVQVFHINGDSPPVLTGLDIVRVDPTLGLVRAEISSTSRFQAFYKNPDFYNVTTISSGLRNPSAITYDPVNDWLFFLAESATPLYVGPTELLMRASDGAITHITDVTTVGDVWFPAYVFTAISYWKPNTLLLGIRSEYDVGAVVSVDVTDPQAPIFSVVSGTGNDLHLTVPIATQAFMEPPVAFAPVNENRFFVAESDGHAAALTPNDVVRVVDVGGAITHVAGTGVRSDDSNDALSEGAATTVPFAFITGLAYEPRTEVVYVSIGDPHHVIRAVNTASTGAAAVRGKTVNAGHTIRIAGGNGPGATGDGTAGVTARVNEPASLSLDDHGVLWFVDRGNNVVRAIDANGFVSRLAGTYGSLAALDGLAADASFAELRGIVAAEHESRYQIDSASGTISTLSTPPTVDCNATPSKCVDCNNDGTIGEGDAPFSQCSRALARASICSKDCVAYRYLGVNGMEIKTRGSSRVTRSEKPLFLLVDPYFSRVRSTNMTKLAPFSEANISDRLVELELQ